MDAKRFIYLGYYLKELEREKFKQYIDYTSRITGMSKSAIIRDVIKSVFTFNISILEYFQFRFFELAKQDRKKWAGTGYMYEYQLQMNPKAHRQILENKTLFYRYYSDLLVHKVADVIDLKNKPEMAASILLNPSGKLVFKKADGKCGEQVKIRNCKDFNLQTLIRYMENFRYELVEEFVQQHPEMNRLSPAAVNTVRIITQLNEYDEVDVLGCRLRISVDSPVDNLAAGNLAAPIDEVSGVVTGSGIYSDITKREEEYHPITGVKINGFQLPFWNETIALAKKAACLHPQNRSIGWDIVITDEGPGLIEGNHDWCKLLWQLPVKKGLKSVLDKGYKNLVANNEVFKIS